MWNQNPEIGTPLPVVESETRTEEPEDVHANLSPSADPSHYSWRSREAEQLEDGHSGDGNLRGDGKTQFPRGDLNHYDVHDMPEVSGDVRVNQYPRVDCLHRIQPKYSVQGLAQYSSEDPTQHADDVSQPTYGTSPYSKQTANLKNTYNPRDSPGLPSNTSRGVSPNLHRYDGEVLGQYGNDILPYTRECAAPGHEEGIPQYIGNGLPQYHIPRPSLKCADSECACWRSKSPDTNKTWPAGRTSMASSNSSTQSGSSGSLLLTAANLAALHCEPGNCTANIAPEDSVSLASSTHFTVVNGMSQRKAKPLPTCCWHRHQLTALVLAMSTIFLIIIMAAVLYVEMRWRDIRMFR